MTGDPNRYHAKVVCDSRSPTTGVRLLTLELQFPRFILAEFNTHRVFSRNSASSRAIPVSKQLAAVRDNCFVPEYWGKNVSGMQAPEPLNAIDTMEAIEEWKAASQAALHASANLACMRKEGDKTIGVHKQLSNRLLEPFLWHKVIVTATEWKNFFALRCSRLAQPEMKSIAMLALEEYSASVPVVRKYHLPYIPAEEVEALEDTQENREHASVFKQLAKISAGRCARVSYLTHDRTVDPDKDMRLAEELRANGHMSPFEHQGYATDDPYLTWSGNFFGWVQYRKTLQDEAAYVGAELDLSFVER